MESFYESWQFYEPDLIRDEYDIWNWNLSDLEDVYCYTTLFSGDQEKQEDEKQQQPQYVSQVSEEVHQANKVLSHSMLHSLQDDDRIYHLLTQKPDVITVNDHHSVYKQPFSWESSSMHAQSADLSSSTSSDIECHPDDDDDFWCQDFENDSD